MTFTPIPFYILCGSLGAGKTTLLMRLLEQEGVEVSLVQTNAPYRPAWVAALRGVRAVARLVPYVRRLRQETARSDVVPGRERIHAITSPRSRVTKNILSASDRCAMDRMASRGFPAGE